MAVSPHGTTGREQSDPEVFIGEGDGEGEHVKHWLLPGRK